MGKLSISLQGDLNRVEHGLEEADGGDDLANGHPVDEFVGFLLRVGCDGCHRGKLSL
jgi:hypothetical protein